MRLKRRVKSNASRNSGLGCPGICVGSEILITPDFHVKYDNPTCQSANVMQQRSTVAY